MGIACARGWEDNPCAMRTAAKVRFIATTMGAAAVIAAAFGQSGALPQRPPDGGTREVLVSILIPSLPNAPFSAIVNTLWVRQLADGSSITLANHRAIARDKEGRIFQERRLLVPEDGKHESVVTQIEISDPVAHQQYICVPRQHVCQLEPFSPPAFVPPPPRGSASAVKQSPNVDLEDLGTQSMAGLETTGTRQTMVMEAGAIGNDRPITVTREFWYSPQLGVNVVSKLQDPRIGKQTFELSNVALGDPDSTLFQPPPNSHIIDLRKTESIPSPQ